jgi:predicted RNA-binding Zn-ribbon protein involved in translation (DUF1610 family)
MAEVKAKTAHRSKEGSKRELGKRCPGCGEVMVATKVMSCRLPKGEYKLGSQLKIRESKGMYWICMKCQYREPVRE